MQVKSHKIKEKKLLGPRDTLRDEAAAHAAPNADLGKFVQGQAIATEDGEPSGRRRGSGLPLTPEL
jgi:hypothetical protein